jgi:hypothetical protein
VGTIGGGPDGSLHFCRSPPKAVSYLADTVACLPMGGLVTELCLVKAKGTGHPHVEHYSVEVTS